MIKIINESMSNDEVIERLYNQLESAVHKVMLSPKFGFLDGNVEEYSKVIVVSEDGDRIKAEIRAESGYDDLWALKDACDPIVQKYDPDAYFDMLDSGIIVAYIEKN